MLSKTPVLAKVVLPKERPILIFSLRELAKLVLRKLYVPIKVWVSFRQSIIVFVTSNHQTTNLVFPNFFHKFILSLSSWKRKQTFHWSKTEKKSVLDRSNKHIIYPLIDFAISPILFCQCSFRFKDGIKQGLVRIKEFRKTKWLILLLPNHIAYICRQTVAVFANYCPKNMSPFLARRPLVDKRIF